MDAEKDSGAGDERAGRPEAPDRPSARARVVAVAILPTLAMVLAGGAGYLKWLGSTAHHSEVARTESVQAAVDTTVAMLSYQPDTVEEDLGAAQGMLTGGFHDSYAGLINDVVIPGSKGERIGAVATVPAAASVSASQNHAVVVVFVNQTTTIGDDPPSETVSTIKVTLDKVDDRWLISDFTPI